MRKLFLVVAFIVLAVLSMTVKAGEKSDKKEYIKTAAQAPEVKLDMSALVKFVRPMEHRRGERLPLLAWTLPIPSCHRMDEPRFMQRFHQALPKLLERGIVPTVILWEGRGLDGPIAMAREIQRAGAPVYLEYRGLPGGEEKLYENCQLWVDSPDNRAGRDANRWPCLIHADPTYAQEWLREAMQKFKSVGVDVKGMWFDWEPIPTAAGGALRSQKKDPRIRKQYPEGVLKNRRTFRTFIEQYKADLYSKAMADPVHAFFPNALVGNYEVVASSDEQGYMSRYGEVHLKRLDAGMVPIYPWSWSLRNWFGRDKKGKGEKVDVDRANSVYWSSLMYRLKTAAQNKRRGKKLVVYVSRIVMMSNTPRFRIRMKKGLYREFLRHAWLRGVDMMFVFNRGNDRRRTWTQSPAESLEELEDTRAVYDEMLEFKEFLNQGTPMNFQRHKPFTKKPSWSGLRLEDRALIRAVSHSGHDETLTISVFDRPVEVKAPPEGRTYIIHRDGVRKIVGEGRL